MSDTEPISALDDDRLAWQIPGDLGLEVARRWRLLNDEVERLDRKCDRLDMVRKYAALLIHQGYTSEASRLLLSADSLEAGRIASEIAERERIKGDSR